MDDITKRAVLIPLADASGRLRAVSILNSGIAPRTGLKLHVRRSRSCKSAFPSGREIRRDALREKAKDGPCVFTLPELGA